MTELHIPDDAVDAAHDLVDDAVASGDHEMLTMAGVRAIAAPVVAAELRQQADRLEAVKLDGVKPGLADRVATFRSGIAFAADELRRRADALDPPAPVVSRPTTDTES